MTLVTKYLWAFFPLPGRAGCGLVGKGSPAGWPCHLFPWGPPTLPRVWRGRGGGVTRETDVEVTVLVSLPSDF